MALTFAGGLGWGGLLGLCLVGYLGFPLVGFCGGLLGGHGSYLLNTNVILIR